jgi:hypothetical protein
MSHRILVLPAALAALALAAPAAAQADTTLKFSELDKGSTFRLIDIAPKAKNPRNPSLSPGDQFVFTNPLADPSGKHIGKLHASCTITKGAKSFDKGAAAICWGVFSFTTGGTLVGVVQEDNLASEDSTGAILGGTGTYAGARGSFTSHETKSGEDDVVTLLG